MDDTYLDKDGDKDPPHDLSRPKSKAGKDKEIISPVPLSPTKLYCK